MNRSLPRVGETYVLYGHTPARITSVRTHEDGALRSVAYDYGTGIGTSAPVLGSTWYLMVDDPNTIAPPAQGARP